MTEDNAGNALDPRERISAGEDAVDALLAESHLAGPHHLPDLIARHASRLGVTDAVAYLADLQQVTLVPFLPPDQQGEEHLEPLPVDSTLAGRTFQNVEVLRHHDGAAGTRVWLPLLDGTARLGVLGVTVADPDLLDDESPLAARLGRFATLVAELIVTKGLYGDAVIKTHRQAEMGLASEMQWSLLPPLTFACDNVVIAAALEPAYEVAGDSVDYAVEPGRARFAVFDGMGHGLQSGLLAALAVAAYRNARRSGRDLVETVRAVDAAVQEVFGGDAFATAVLAELDIDSGLLTWVNLGHPDPLLLREGRLVKELRNEPGLPLGLNGALNPSGEYEVGTEHLEPGDRLLFYTDGVVEARSADGAFFGIDRLVDVLVRNFAGELPAPETMRRVVRTVLAHQQGRLTDDATMLLVEWRSAREGRLLP